MSEKTVAQKLLIKEGYRVLVVNAPPGYIASLTGQPTPNLPATNLPTPNLPAPNLPANVVLATSLDNPGPFDLIQAFVSSQGEFEAGLSGLKALLKPKGLLWITYPKGAARIKSDINRDTIWRYARTAGLEGVALVAVDETWSAMRLKVVS